MTFLSPLTLFALSLLALPIVIHLLSRRKAKRFDFPSLRHVRNTLSFRLRPKRVRRPLLLALRLIALALLIMGFARPLWTIGKKNQLAKVILLDASLSMRARGRADLARSRASDIINRLGSGERAAVLSFDTKAKVLSEFGADHTILLESVNRYTPGFGVADFSEAIRAASTILLNSGEASSEVYVISDFQSANLDRVESFASATTRIITVPIGAAFERNAFFTDITATRTDRTVDLSATEVVLALDGRAAKRRAFVIASPSGSKPEVEWRTESNGQITGRLRTVIADDFDDDDETYFLIDPKRNDRVTLIETENSGSVFLGAALESSAHSRGRVPFELDRRRDIPLDSSQLRSSSLVVVTLTASVKEPELKSLADYVTNGGNLQLFFDGEVNRDVLNLFAEHENAFPFKRISRIDDRSTLTLSATDRLASPLRAMSASAIDSIQSLRVHRGFSFETRGNANVLMRWNDGRAAMVSSKVGKGTLNVVGVPLEKTSSDFGLHPSFPLFIDSIVGSALRSSGFVAGFIGSAPELIGAPNDAISIFNPAGKAVQTTISEISARPELIFDRPGIFRVDSKGESRFVAVNTPSAESERALTAPDFAAKRFATAASQTQTTPASLDVQERAGKTWIYFLSAAFLLILTELFVAIRGNANSIRSEDVA
jgi:hypothetical protein